VAVPGTTPAVMADAPTYYLFEERMDMMRTFDLMYKFEYVEGLLFSNGRQYIFYVHAN